MTKEERAKLLEEGKTEVEITQLEAIADLKAKMATMVDQEDVDALQKEYDELMAEYVNNRQAPKKEEAVLRPAKEVAAEIGQAEGGNMTNRAYISTALEYRKSLLAETGLDCFADNGESTDDSIEVAGKLQKLLDENESPVEFRIKMNSVLKDDSQLVRALNKRKNKK